MSDKDYEEILDQNVDDIKSSVRELDDPDYQRLLELEREGKDRKTVRVFLEDRIEEQNESEAEDEAEDYDEEVVEEIEENTSSGLLGGFSPGQIAVGGTALGLIVGLVIGFGATGMTGADAQVSEAEARDTVQGLFDATGSDASVSNLETRNGMYYANVTTQQEVNGTTQSSSQTFYVSPDAELLFPEVQSPLMQTPINVEQTMAQLEQQAQQQPQTGNTTPQ